MSRNSFLKAGAKSEGEVRSLGDLNDLYNTQDGILLTEIIENRFQAMQNTYGFNPRKCNLLVP